VRHNRLNTGWFVRPGVNRFAELTAGAAEWEPVTVPHDAMIGIQRSPGATAASGYFPDNSWQYRRPLDVAPESSGRTLILKFEGVYRDSVVLVNDTIAAKHPYGYSTFYVPIDHLVRAGQPNEIGVSARAGSDSRWYSGAGIYRDVWLLSGGLVHLTPDRIDVRTPDIDADGATVAVAAEVANRSGSTSVTTLRTELLDPEGLVVAMAETPVTTFPGDRLTTRQRLFVPEPRRWSPSSPHLYRCRLSLLEGGDLLDQESTSFGIRHLALDPVRGLRINGEPIELRGACVHHDNGPLGAASFDRAEERRVEILQAAGFNAIRSAHNPMSESMLRACDRLGMVVMDETFDMWAQPKTDDDYSLRIADWWEADVEAMVRKDLNHPSVVFYSIGNEIPDGSTETGLQLGRALAEKVRALDDTRFVTQAVTGLLVAGAEAFAEFRASTATEEEGVNTAALSLGELMGRAVLSPVIAAKTEEAFSHLDVAGYNYMETRFATDAELYPQRVVVATESHPSRMDACWAEVVAHPNVIGDFTWTGWDYLGEAGVGRIEYGSERSPLAMSAFHGSFPWLTAWCGDIDITGDRRPQSYYREIVFGLRADPYIAVEPPWRHEQIIVHDSPWGWPDVVPSWTWEGHEGSPVNVHVYARADEVELLINGISQGRTEGGAGRRFVAEFDIRYEPGVVEAVAWQGGREVGRAELRSAVGDVRLQAQADRSEIRGDGLDLAFVRLALVDEAGTPCNTLEREVTVEVEGPAVLQAFGTAAPCTEERFDSSSGTTFGGRALAIVRAMEPGDITVTATAAGCPPQVVPIVATTQEL
jgi:beta-galactosidase